MSKYEVIVNPLPEDGCGCFTWFVIILLGIFAFLMSLGAIAALPAFLFWYLFHAYTYFIIAFITITCSFSFYKKYPIFSSDFFAYSKIHTIWVFVILFIQNIAFSTSPLGGWENIKEYIFNEMQTDGIVGVFLAGCYAVILPLLAAFCLCFVCSLISLILISIIKEMQKR